VKNSQSRYAPVVAATTPNAIPMAYSLLLSFLIPFLIPPLFLAELVAVVDLVVSDAVEARTRT
jgi:hypothetical protein